MKLLTANFITCAVKTCKSSPLSFPLHFRDAELEQRELDYNPVFLANILPRLDWDAIKVVAAEVWFLSICFLFLQSVARARTCCFCFSFSFFFLSRKDFKGADEKVWGGVWVRMNL